MLKRIPHRSQDISGESKTREYLKSHEKHAHIQFKAFMKSVRAAYRPTEIRRLLSASGIDEADVKTPFPYFWQTVLIVK